MLTTYYMNWNEGKDASVYSVGTKGGYKVELSNMKTSDVTRTKTFKGRYASHAANQFAARELGLMDEVRKLCAYEAWCRNYDAEVKATMEQMAAAEGDSEYGRNLRNALAAYA